MTRDEKYARLIQAVEECNLETKYDVVAWSVGYFGMVDNETFELIERLYLDMFIDQ